MWRRIAIIVPLCMGTLVAVASPASALCVVLPLWKVVESSDAVWWATVTDAAPSSDHRGSSLELTVRLDDVLKGPGTEGESATVFRSTCGFFVDPEAAEAVADQQIGQQLLFIGDVGGRGELDAYSDVIEPQGLSPEQQYRRALTVLGLEPPVASSPPIPIEPNKVPWLVLVGAVVVAIISVLAVARTRRRTEARPPTT